MTFFGSFTLKRLASRSMSSKTCICFSLRRSLIERLILLWKFSMIAGTASMMVGCTSRMSFLMYLSPRLNATVAPLYTHERNVAVHS